MHGCSPKATSASLVYWCLHRSKTDSTGPEGVDYERSVQYTLGESPPKASKQLGVCQLAPRRPSVVRRCDSSAVVTVVTTTPWAGAGIRPNCKGVVC